MTIEKLRPTFTFDEDRLAAQRALTPEAFADGKINWETLKEALGEHLEDDDAAAEHFGLTWPGKRSARRLATQRPTGALVPAPGEGVNEETTHNIFIEGENLEVLKLLQKSYAGRVKMIYIDPPYNTGNDFIYNDAFAQTREEYWRQTGQSDDAGRLLVSNPKSGGRYHSNWLNMMYPRLRLARTLLREDGVIFVSIDDNEVHNLRELMSEVFGEENFVATVIWQKIFAPKNTARQFSEDHDYVVVYARDTSNWEPIALPRSEEADSRYANPDDDPRGPWASDNLLARNYYSKGQYEVTSQNGTTHRNPVGTYWRVSHEKFLELNRDDRIWWGADGRNMPRLKRFLSEVKQGIVPQTLWFYSDVGHTQEAKKELLEYVAFQNTDNVLDTVKPTRLLQRMLQLATNRESPDIVLDFFAGSATAAHAVLKQNWSDGGYRRFVMVQFPEDLPKPEPVLKTIADIGKERIRGVIKRTQEQGAGKLPAERSTPEDLGFKVYKLASSSYKPWRDYDGTSTDALQQQFAQFASPLVDGWQADNLLVEVILMEGFPLDSTVTPLPDIKRNKVLQVTSDMVEHRLFVCLDEHVHTDTIAALKLDQEDLFICLDAALTDEAKARLQDGRRVKVI